MPARENLHFFVGETLTAREFTRNSPVPVAFSPVFTAMCAQEVLEPILRRHAERYAPGAIRFGAEVTRVAQDEAEVIVSLADDQVIRARYVVGADGVDSVVRGECEMPLDGPDALCRNVNIHYRAGSGVSRGAPDGPDPQPRPHPLRPVGHHRVA